MKQAVAGGDLSLPHPGATIAPVPFRATSWSGSPLIPRTPSPSLTPQAWKLSRVAAQAV
jgi:hypothetical protein